MKLFEHPDFEQAIIRAADHFRPRGLREAIIEKDYYVTEALRIIEQEAGGRRQGHLQRRHQPGVDRTATPRVAWAGYIGPDDP